MNINEYKSKTMTEFLECSASPNLPFPEGLEQHCISFCGMKTVAPVT